MSTFATTARSEKMLLILDLDETLVFATERQLDRPSDFIVGPYYVYRRPGLEQFIERVADHFDLAVWSSASDPYVESVVDQIFADASKLQFVWGRSRAKLRRSRDDAGYLSDPWDHLNYVKPLSKVKKAGWKLERVLIVDDTPGKCVENYGNAIYPIPYEGAVDDNELDLLGRYLITISSEPNVRSFEKRLWRNIALQLLERGEYGD